ncbi:MAG TPA: tRNA guanosine(34) transglycosylase Tgt [Chloroflexota bacterium]|nr:tRNA guanosine(34) transglycosylase Tgt [Chloroflexota bacterium]
MSSEGSPDFRGHPVLSLAHGQLRLPAFLPDGTRGVVRSVDARDLQSCGVPAVMMNTFHLMQKPGSSTIDSLGGLHKMSGWDGPIVTDSGGFQIFSLIRQNPQNGSVNRNGLTFRTDSRERKFSLTPEKAVQLQLKYGADIVYCLDDCTHVGEAEAVQTGSVARTIEWARRCKVEYQHLLEQKRTPREKRPLIFAVIQGGGDLSLRKRCAEELLAIGFDGFGYGGWPLDADGNLLADLLEFTRGLVPDCFPMHALGIGDPRSIVRCAAMGYQLFDSALPTRDARDGRLYRFQRDPTTGDLDFTEGWFARLYVEDDKYTKADRPISEYCDCLCCQRYSLGYLHHLHRLNDCLFPRLATIHNLRFMTQLTGFLAASNRSVAN